MVQAVSFIEGQPVSGLLHLRDPAPDGGVPNNWQSKFGGPAWQYDEQTGQYFLTLFDQTQADLNWENEEVRKAVRDMIKFWAEKEWMASEWTSLT